MTSISGNTGGGIPSGGHGEGTSGPSFSIPLTPPDPNASITYGQIANLSRLGKKGNASEYDQKGSTLLEVKDTMIAASEEQISDVTKLAKALNIALTLNDSPEKLRQQQFSTLNPSEPSVPIITQLVELEQQEVWGGNLGGLSQASHDAKEGSTTISQQQSFVGTQETQTSAKQAKIAPPLTDKSLLQEPPEGELTLGTQQDVGEQEPQPTQLQNQGMQQKTTLQPPRTPGALGQEQGSLTDENVLAQQLPVGTTEGESQTQQVKGEFIQETMQQPAELPEDKTKLKKPGSEQPETLLTAPEEELVTQDKNLVKKPPSDLGTEENQPSYSITEENQPSSDSINEPKSLPDSVNVANPNPAPKTGGNPWLAGNAYTEFLVEFSELRRMLEETKGVQGMVEVTAMNLIGAICDDAATAIMNQAEMQKQKDISEAVCAGIAMVGTAICAAIEVSSYLKMAPEPTLEGDATFRSNTANKDISTSTVQGKAQIQAEFDSPANIKIKNDIGEPTTAELKQFKTDQKNLAKTDAQKQTVESYKDDSTATQDWKLKKFQENKLKQFDAKDQPILRNKNGDTSETVAAINKPLQQKLQMTMTISPIFQQMSTMVSKTVASAYDIPIGTEQARQKILEGLQQIISHQLQSTSDFFKGNSEMISQLIQTLNQMHQQLASAMQASLSATK